MSFRRSSYLCFALRLLFARCFDSGSAASLFLKKNLSVISDSVNRSVALKLLSEHTSVRSLIHCEISPEDAFFVFASFELRVSPHSHSQQQPFCFHSRRFL